MKFRLDKWIFTCGKADAGKTTWIREHCRPILEIKAVPEDKPGWHGVYFYDYNNSDYNEFAKEKNAHYWTVEYGTEDEAASFMMSSYSAGNNLTVLEEADNYLRSKNPDIIRFVNTARNRGIGTIVSAKRAKAVTPFYRTRFNYLVLFKTTLADDIEYLEDWVGIKQAKKRRHEKEAEQEPTTVDGHDNLEFLRYLEQGEHIIIDLDEQTISEVLKLNIKKSKK